MEKETGPTLVLSLGLGFSEETGASLILVRQVRSLEKGTDLTLVLRPEFGERSCRPNPGLEFRERNRPNTDLAGSKLGERNGPNLVSAGSEFEEKTWARVWG